LRRRSRRSNGGHSISPELPSEYDRVDAGIYDAYTGASINGDTEFYVEEARRAGSPVLELGCGTGRILIPIAAAGVDVTGVDRAPSMLAVAKAKVAAQPVEVQSRIELVEGDMRELRLDRRFALIAIPFRAFLHLLTVEDQRQALARIREHLVDGGRLVLNVFDPHLGIIASRLGHEGGRRERRRAFAHPRTGRTVVQWDAFRYDPERQVLEGDFVFDELDGDGTVVATSYSPLTLRWVYRYEMQHLLERAGFDIEALHGDFRRGPFRHGGEQVWIARAS
jgi:SAM-dependent methyltransferase